MTSLMLAWKVFLSFLSYVMLNWGKEALISTMKNKIEKHHILQKDRKKDQLAI